MAKIAILGDLHWGMRNDNSRIRQHQCDFFDNEFFPYLEKNGIKEIAQLGDFFDNRKYISMPTLGIARKHFIDPCNERKITVKIIAGNHDLPYRYSNKYSSVQQIFSDSPNFHVYENECFTDEHGIKYFPWISNENSEDLLKELRTGGSIAVGHFETVNFAMERNQICSHGTTTLDDFKNFEMVISGHFHHRSRKKNVTYVGVPYEMSFNDCLQKKGFHILDTEKRTLTFIENKTKLFHSIEMNTDEEKDPEIKNLDGCFVRMRIIKNNDPQRVGNFISKINSQSPFDFRIIDKSIERFNSENLDDVVSNQSTEDLIKEYVENVAGDHSLKEGIIEKTLSILVMAREKQISEVK